MNDPALVRDDYERLHASLDDANLDAVAGIAGCASQIGRLNYLDDATLEGLVDRMLIADGGRVLDLGCGRGFVGRWLYARGFQVAYAGIDYSRSALEAVRRLVPGATLVQAEVRAPSGGPYDAIFAIESVWSVNAELAERLRVALAPEGRFAWCVSTLDASDDAHVRLTVDALRTSGFDVERVAFAAGHAEAVGRLCAALLIEPPEDLWCRERLTAEAARVLAALRDGTFRSDLILATARS